MAIMYPTLRRLYGSLTIVCMGCGRRVTWPKEVAVGLLGPDLTPPEVRRRLRCGTCGARGADEKVTLDGDMR